MIVEAVDSPSDSSTGSTMADRADTKEDAELAASGLAPRVQRLLDDADTKRGPSAPDGEVGSQSSPNTTMRGSGATVPSCVRAGIGRTDAPIAADQITYEGTAAYLVVLPRVSDPARVDVYVVDSACTGTSPQSPGDVLLKDVYKRG
ncbi:hypothetical protein [Streptomyces sp. 8N616]|uniref:hypothetical protein n=1 Tax=Streptomyces sp. 8N616 TaxID=3457414 RepID=UPI003FCF06AD